MVRPLGARAAYCFVARVARGSRRSGATRGDRSRPWESPSTTQEEGSSTATDTRGGARCSPLSTLPVPIRYPLRQSARDTDISWRAEPGPCASRRDLPRSPYPARPEFEADTNVFSIFGSRQTQRSPRPHAGLPHPTIFTTLRGHLTITLEPAENLRPLRLRRRRLSLCGAH